LVTQFVIALARAVPGGEPLASPGTGCGPGDDSSLLVASQAAAAWSAAWSPAASSAHTVIDAEQGLHGQVRKVMDDMNGPAPRHPGNRQPGTVPVARTGALE